MCIITTKIIEKQIFIIFEGTIDSNNAEQVENEVFMNIKNNLSNGEKVVLDFENLTYISSAGLRIILKTKKAFDDVKIINAMSEVYDVLDMTGFTSILDVRRQLRTIAVDDCPLIGEGYIGKVYRLDDERIIKVFVRMNNLEDIYKEREKAKKAFILGIPTAISYEIVKVKGGGYGSIFELVKSDCFNKLFIDHPENYLTYSKQYTNLLKNIITTHVPKGELPDKKIDAYEWIDGLEKNHLFEQPIINKMRHMVDALEDTGTMVHGDYHIKNIMIQSGEPVLIDMETLGAGHPIFEFAAFYLTYIGYPETDPGNLEKFLGIPQETGNRLFADSIEAIYGEKTDAEKQEIIDKITLFANMWFTYKTFIFEPENHVRMERCKSEVLRLINQLNDFSF